MKTVVVGMSGGVDSSVAALLLKKQGYHVIGLFMKNWEDDEACQSAVDYADVVAVCAHIGISHYAVNFARIYWERVFEKCLQEFAQGYTPNPDVLCNQEIKFKVFLQKALELNADYLATGHYCRNLDQTLARGVDADKDQSYFLYTITKNTLQRVLFPLGDLLKSDVRAIAQKEGLPTAAKKESMGICFIGKRNFKDFLGKYIPKKPGHFETPEGRVIGEHDGCSFYTIGQRKGLKIGGPGEAWYVIAKDIDRNVVVVTQGEDDPRLFHSNLIASNAHWINELPQLPFSCTAKIRYRSPDVECVIENSSDNRLLVHFDEPQKAITPKQAIVFYDREICLGGATIEYACN